MNADVKRKWLEALRSGRYEQTSHLLKRELISFRDEEKPRAGYCCLGVLCDISGLAEWRKQYNIDSCYYYGASAVDLPKEVVEWAGVSKEQEQQLTSLNDSGHRFETIADFIEVNL